MKINKLEIESSLLRKNVFQIDELLNGDEFNKQEEDFVKKHKPFYVQCILESSKIKLIHSLEDAGFRFIEFRVTKTLNSNTFNPVGENVFYPYQLHQITEESYFSSTKQLLLDSYADDRFSKDPLMKNNISKARLLGYLQKSYANQPQEFLYGLINANTGDLVAFISGEFIRKNEVQFYLNGSLKGNENSKYGNMLDILLIGLLVANGIKWFHSISSGLNIFELNLTTRDLPYRIEATSVILRKIYN